MPGRNRYLADDSGLPMLLSYRETANSLVYRSETNVSSPMYEPIDLSVVLLSGEDDDTSTGAIRN